MPLIILCGYPSSGKTKLAIKLKTFLEEKSSRVEILSDSTYKKNETFSGKLRRYKFDTKIHKLFLRRLLTDVTKEKIMRANLKSEVNRLLGSDTIVILDSGNYIKGYRYELYCIAKLTKTTNLIIHCDINSETAWDWNVNKKDSEIYDREVFDGLIQRFEAPDSRNRWDKPLITVLNDGEISMDQVSNAVFSTQTLKPNKSTKQAAVNSPNFLYELDRQTQDVVNFILDLQRSGQTSGIKIPSSNVQLNLPRTVSAGELARLRRQFISYSKSHISEENVIDTFIQYLNTTIN